MLRLLMLIIAVATAFAVALLLASVVTMMGGGIFTIIFLLAVSGYIGLIVADVFRMIFGRRTSVVSTPRRRLSFPGPLAILAFPFTVLSFILVGDPLEDEIRARNYRSGMRLRRERETREKLVNARAIREAGRKAGLEWLRSKQ